jgi:hypothetical protein
MPRYYFHVRDEHGLRRDAEGVELPDVEAARRKALDMACEAWSKRPPDAAHNDQAFEISDETGDTMLSVPFSEAFAERAVT